MGRIEAIHLGRESGRALSSREAVEAVAGRGLLGDRYAVDGGSFPRRGRSGRDVTLISGEALEAMERETGIRLPASESRRNLLTRGIALDALIGRRFRIGPVLCYGVSTCAPCNHLEELTQAGVRHGLAGRGGLRADILEGGTIRVGDSVIRED